MADSSREFAINVMRQRYPTESFMQLGRGLHRFRDYAAAIAVRVGLDGGVPDRGPGVGRYQDAAGNQGLAAASLFQLQRLAINLLFGICYAVILLGPIVFWVMTP